ncbi:response regulator [Ornithinimicrobium pratense]|uniref:Response regulator transcription factor n=1 Tax=Ornithinimicrobium pratense TaxID=2593973 RepID=A0A5J6V9R1_9MICO|nr:response regulator transcription factor [Ornithinimicrobium pratense]QFG69966.1 response regulator transcription factor [Ornithinimicrobium pratense]
MTDPPADDRVRVVVVDDQTLVRQGIRTLLDLASICVVGEAGDGAEAVAVVEQERPDVVLLDLRMPRFDGLWTLRELRERGLEVPVLVLTTFDDDTLVLDALREGARGYLLKDVTLEQLARGVHTLAEGGTLIAPSITGRLLTALRSGPAPSAAHSPASAAVEPLTTREVEVLRLVAEGYSNREIAGALHLAEGTVKNHVSAVLVKLNARDRTNAVLRALHEGILG